MKTSTISKSELRRSKLQKNTSYFVSNRGKKEFLLLPINEQSEEILEKYEISQSRDFLVQELKKSKQSGRSSLVI